MGHKGTMLPCRLYLFWRFRRLAQDDHLQMINHKEPQAESIGVSAVVGEKMTWPREDAFNNQALQTKPGHANKVFVNVNSAVTGATMVLS